MVRFHLRQSQPDEDLNREQIIAAHPELMPELGRELRKLELIEDARLLAESNDFANCADAPKDRDRKPLPQGLPPDSFPGYEIVRRIHGGGQGVVYQAVQKATKRTVAIKVMREGPFGGPRENVRFEREVQILATLNHPHIVTIHDSGRAAEHFYYVMDYISGLPLDAFMAGRECSIDETLRLFAKMCDAVNAAHLSGIIHRDLKPGNICMDAKGEPNILDFGLAKIATGGEGKTKSPAALTVTGQFVGSVPWSSPEQVDGSPGHIDLRTDVYSLGVILYQMLTGRFPYEVTGSMRDVMDNIINAEPVRPSSIRRRIGDEVDTIVLKCLSKEQERRYQSAGDLGRDINRYLQGQAIEAKRDSTWYMLKKTAHRYRVPTAVVATFFLVVVGFGMTAWIMYRRAAHEAATANRVQSCLESMFTELGANASQLTVREILEQGAERVAERLKDEPVAQVQLMETIANRYQSLDLPASAAEWLNKAVRIRREILGNDKAIIASRLTVLGGMYRYAGMQDQSENHLRESLVLYRSMSGGGGAGELVALRELAQLRHDQGVYEDAERLHREALQTCRNLYSEPHPDTIEMLLKFGAYLGNVGRQQEAKELLEEALEMARDLYYADHLQLADALCVLGGQLQDMGQHKLALPYSEEAVAMNRRLFPGDNIKVAGSMVQLGLLRKDMGDYKTAEALIRQGLEMRLGVSGRQETNRTAMDYHSLAKVYSDAGDWLKAETPCRKSLGIYQRLLPRDHFMVARPMTHLGRILVNQARYAEAEPLLREALNIRRKRKPAGHWKTAKTESLLGACLSGLGRFEEAEPLLLQSYPIIAKDRGPRHRRTVESLHRIINLYEAWGRPNDEADWRAELSLINKREHKGAPVGRSVQKLGRT